MLVANHGYKRKIDNQSNKMKLYSSIKDKCHLLALKPGYVMHPSPAQIYDRKFMIKDLKIRYNNTEVFWKGIVDLRYLKAPLSQLVDLGPTHIEVYPNQREKALAGKQLNKTCFVTFSKLPYLNKRKLTKICEQTDCQILALNQLNKQFTVQIHHFSKYSFNSVTQKQGETQQQEKKGDSSLVNYIIQKHDKELQMQIREKQKERVASGTGMSSNHVENTKMPTQETQRQVAEHNMKKGHSIDEDRIKGSSITYGVNSVVSSSAVSANKQLIVFNNIQNKNRDNLYIVFNILKDANSINTYILSPDVKFQVKRVLVLYMILFHIENSKFDFQRDGQTIKLVPKQGTVDTLYFLVYLKNWFEWVINEDSGLIVGDRNQLVINLALRRTKQYALKLLQGQQPNRFEDTQFLSSIQDQFYRREEASRNLSLQLREIVTGNMTIFKKFPWIVKLGVFLWYYNFKDWPHISADVILDQQPYTHYNLQRHMLRTFAQKSFLKQNLSKITELQNPLWWFISNVNTQKQKRIIQSIRQLQVKTNLLKSYDEYRFNILMELVQMYGDSNVTLQLISNQKYLKKEQITRILTAFIRKYPNEAERVPHTEWRQYANLLHQNTAYRYYSSSRYIKALEQFTLCTSLSKNSEQILKQIVSKQEIICGFHIKTIQKIKNILQKIKSQTIAIQVMFLNTILGQQQLKKNKVQRMIQLCYRIPELKVRMRMLDQLFNAIIKSPNMVILLRKDKNFEYWLVSYYPDPTYQLQLKFAKFKF